MKAAMRKLAPVFNTNRMVRQYAEQFYIKAANRWETLTASDLEEAKRFSAWRDHLGRNFRAVRIQSVTDNMDSNGQNTRVGRKVRVEAVLDLGKLSPDDVSVELFYGPRFNRRTAPRSNTPSRCPARAAGGPGIPSAFCLTTNCSNIRSIWA